MAMFMIIEGLPDDVVGVEAAGRVTKEDYRKTLVPEVRRKLAARDSLRLLFVAGKKFKGYETAAVWKDMTFGLRHWHDFSRIAVVTDSGWLRTAAHVFAPFFPGAIRVFPLNRIAAAKKWIASRGRERGLIETEIISPALVSIGAAVDRDERRHDGGTDRLRNRLSQKRGPAKKTPPVSRARTR